MQRLLRRKTSAMVNLDSMFCSWPRLSCVACLCVGYADLHSFCMVCISHSQACCLAATRSRTCRGFQVLARLLGLVLALEQAPALAQAQTQDAGTLMSRGSVRTTISRCCETQGSAGCVGYAPPLPTAVVDADDMPTTGGRTFTLTGTNFGFGVDHVRHARRHAAVRSQRLLGKLRSTPTSAQPAWRVNLRQAPTRACHTENRT